MTVNASSFAIASVRVASLIHGSVLMSSRSTERRFAIIARARSFAAGEKRFSTNAAPTASPSPWSTTAVQRSFSGCCCFAPVSFEVNANASSTNGCERSSSNAFSACQRRYALTSASGVLVMTPTMSCAYCGFATLMGALSAGSGRPAKYVFQAKPGAVDASLARSILL